MDLTYFLKIVFVTYLAVIGVALLTSAFLPTANTPQQKVEVAK